MKSAVLAVLISLPLLAAEDAGTAAPDAGLASTAADLPELPPEQTGRFTRLAMAGKPLWATLRTTKGDLVVKLLSDDAPNTVANFVALATGEREWTHPFTNEKSRRPLYDGVTFHRVIPAFMAQTGDPTATGRGGPGYRFSDELEGGRKFDKPGLLAMANYGPNTNGSQFFIVVAKDAHHLDGKHTIFGEVVKGLDVADAISKVPRDSRERPTGEEIVLTRIEISEKAPKGVAAGKKR